MSGLVSDTSHSVENPATLARELQAAEENITALTSENTTLKGQVEDLQNLLGTRSATVRGILASVLSRPPESPYDTLVVDQGEASGVFAGALVTGNGRVPLGRVASVTNGSARVTLFSASGVKTDAWVGEKRLPVTLTGMGGGTFSATAPTDAKIVAGDTVFVLGGVAIGTVVRSDVDTSSPTAVLRVQSATNPFSLLWVLIARPL
jgi:cell shape-determining protein MreC